MLFRLLMVNFCCEMLYKTYYNCMIDDIAHVLVVADCTASVLIHGGLVLVYILGF